MTNDGLLTFQRVAGSDGGQLVPDLATSIPRPSDGGKTYTFQLRSGIRYSNGRPVRASDFRHGLERFFELHRAPPYFQSIVGAPACIRKPRQCDLARGITSDDLGRTVSFHLSVPDPEFLYQLALPFAAAVPASTPSRIAKTGSLVPATGPYMIADYVPNKRAVAGAEPALSRVVTSSAARRLSRSDRLGPDQGRRGGGDGRRARPRRPDARRHSDQPDRGADDPVHGSTAREHRRAARHDVPQRPDAPFDHVGVRRALAYAVDHDETIRLGSGAGQALPTCQILPPSFPVTGPTVRTPSIRAVTAPGPSLTCAKRGSSSNAPIREA